MTNYDISCNRLCELTTDYLDAAMDAGLRTTFEQHLVVCDYCLTHLDQLRITRMVLGSLPAPEPSRDRLVASLGRDDG
jgi:hypothetical protein